MIPEGYEMPSGVTGDEVVYALAEQPGESSTTLYMVLKVSPGKQEILAGDCYPNQGMEIVDALRGQETLKEALEACRPNGGVPAYVIVDDVIEILERKR